MWCQVAALWQTVVQCACVTLVRHGTCHGSMGAPDISRTHLRWIAAEADCDVRTVRREVQAWLAGATDSSSAARARVRGAVRRLARDGALSVETAARLGLAAGAGAGA
jgi:hypothetical protein